MKEYSREELLYKLPTFADHRGMLTAIENGEQLPFKISRAFWIYEIPNQTQRGGHAHISCDELLVAIHGSFDVMVDDGTNQYTYHMDNPRIGLLVPSNTWCELQNFSIDCVCLALASQKYSDEGYINNYEEFKNLTKNE